ncbi:MAG: NAD(P)-dependent oxidoreductase [Desulfomonilaceae bacterium]|nr:NAD(P)-dependent oxidoreductase [Desulfomonilaceae bacterium]
MRFLVTGGTGFIGSHMVELLLARGDDVVCPVRNISSLRYLRGIPARVIEIDGMEPEIAKGPPFDYVVHIAGATRALDYAEYFRANVEYTRHLLEIMTHAGQREALKRFVLVSSQAVAGPSPDNGACCVESDPLRPLSLYGRSKLEAERLVKSFKPGLPITIVRPPTVFGPRDTDVLSLFKCARYRLAPCIAGPDRLVSIIYVKDLVEGILSAAVSPAAEGECYFLANPEPVIWREFALLVARVMGFQAVSIPLPLPALKAVALAGDLGGRIRGAASLFRSEKLEEMRQRAWVCSPQKACKEIGWEPRTPLVGAIGHTANWYKENGWL